MNLGARSIQMLFRGVFFRFVPTILELAVVAVVFGRLFSPVVSVVLTAAVIAYIAFSVTVVGVSPPSPFACAQFGGDVDVDQVQAEDDRIGKSSVGEGDRRLAELGDGDPLQQSIPGSGSIR